MQTKVRAKKHLGQHFLTDLNIARSIADTITLNGYEQILEIGPGMGVLTQFLLKKPVKISVIELDKESVEYLNVHFSDLKDRIINHDFLKFPIVDYFKRKPFAIIGNFPYNISSQIVFKLLEIRDFVPEFCGMFQKEVAQRICQEAGSKTYGILSVLTQAFYHTEYLFSVNENVFSPPPKVKSGVIRLIRKENYKLTCDEKLFFVVVKTTFLHRRKTLRNTLKGLIQNKDILTDSFFDKRPEELSVDDFIYITQQISIL